MCKNFVSSDIKECIENKKEEKCLNLYFKNGIWLITKNYKTVSNKFQNY